MKNILNKMFGWGFFGIPNWAVFILAGCVTPLLGILAHIDILSKPFNPIAIILWFTGLVSLAVSIIYTTKNDK